MATQRPTATPAFPRTFGRYQLLAPLAQGGAGLYLAVTGDRDLEKLVVIKTPQVRDEDSLTRLRDEARVLLKLSHGNLVPVLDAGQIEGEPFVVMDFVEGKNLRALWNRAAREKVAFPVDVAVYIVKELCRGLGYAHSFGDLQLVHRHVSPINVLVSYAGEVRLGNFENASSTLKRSRTSPGQIRGTDAYLSPEQARGEPLDRRSDVYAAGIILWELLTGRQLFPPRHDDSSAERARRRMSPVLPPSERASRVPPALDSICCKALAPAREDRFVAAEDLRDALGAWLAGAAPTTDAGHLERFIRFLFAEDIGRERTDREALVARIYRTSSQSKAS